MRTRVVVAMYLVAFILACVLVNDGIKRTEAREDTIKDLKSSNADLLRFYSMEKVRSYELEKRSADRDKIELELRACLKQQVVWVNRIEDIKWQMDAVISSCPGRSRPPKLPRP